MTTTAAPAAQSLTIARMADGGAWHKFTAGTFHCSHSGQRRIPSLRNSKSYEATTWAQVVEMAKADGHSVCGRCFKVAAIGASDEVRHALETAGKQAAMARARRDAEFAALATAVRAAVAAGLTEVDAARLAQVDRMTIRKWVGKL